MCCVAGLQSARKVLVKFIAMGTASGGVSSNSSLLGSLFIRLSSCASYIGMAVLTWQFTYFEHDEPLSKFSFYMGLGSAITCTLVELPLIMMNSDNVGAPVMVIEKIATTSVVVEQPKPFEEKIVCFPLHTKQHLPNSLTNFLLTLTFDTWLMLFVSLKCLVLYFGVETLLKILQHYSMILVFGTVTHWCSVC